MAMRFVLDRVEGCRGRNTINGLELVRHCTVFDVPIKTTATAWQVLVDVITDPQCPPLRSAFPDPRVPGCLLEEHVPTAVEAGKRRFEMDLIYRSGPVAPLSGQIIWTAEESPIVNHILTNATSNQGAALAVWYKPKEPSTTTAAPSGAIIKGAQVHKVEVDRIFRVTGRATGAQWGAFKTKARSARGRTNSTPWGNDPRGTWLALNPHTRTQNYGGTYDILLEFWYKELGWWGLSVYTDEFGNIPSDVATESALRKRPLPLEGTYTGLNGVMLASVQKEINFNTIFDFNPDQPPLSSTGTFNGTGW